MSLVILTNDASESVVAGRESSIFKPFSFRNSLTSTIEIPIQAQIALQSAKLVMDGSLQVGEANGVFYLYLGKYVDPDGVAGAVPRSINETGYAPIRLQLFNGTTSTQSVTPQELGNELQRVLNETGGRGIFHPNYVGAPQVVSIKTDAATGAFEGYNIDLKYISGVLERVGTNNGLANLMAFEAIDATRFQRRAKPTGGLLPLGPMNLLAASTAAAVAVKPYIITAGGGAGTAFVQMTAGGVGAGMGAFQSDTFGTTFNCPPISTFGGVCEFQIGGCTLQNIRAGVVDNRTCRFMCGLSRVSTTSSGNAARRPAPPNFFFQAGAAQVGSFPPGPSQGGLLAWIANYFDYAVCVDGGGFLRVIQCSQTQNVPTGANGGGLQNDSARTQNIDYTQGGTAGAPFNTPYVFSDLSGFTALTGAGNASNFTAVNFKVEGEVVTIQMRNAGGLVPLITFNAGAGAVNIKPAQQTCWNMQPIMLMNLAKQRPGAAQASARVIGDYNIKLNSYEQVPDVNNTFGNNIHVPSTSPSYYNALLSQENGVSGLYHRIERAVDSVLPYSDINRGLGVYLGNRPVVILAEDGVYTPSQGANSRDLLGFNGFPAALQTLPPWVADAFDGTRITTQRLGSGVIPAGVSTKSLFIRIDNLTQETINAGNGNMSRIIAHLPISDNLKDAGKIFYEPNSLTYLDLKNVEPMRVNFLDASVVYADERVCRSLVGSSVIVIHIREKPKKDE